MSENATTPLSAEESAALRKLEEALSHDAEAWMGTPGETLSGVITQVSVRSSDYGPYPALTIRQEDGSEVVFHAFRTVAKNELVRQQPKSGDSIAILYIGPDPSAEGKAGQSPPHLYRIRSTSAGGAEIDWSRFDTSEGAA